MACRLVGRRQAIIWTNAGILLTGPLGTNFNDILIWIQTFSFKRMHLKVSYAKWRPFCLGLNVLKIGHWDSSHSIGCQVDMPYWIWWITHKLTRLFWYICLLTYHSMSSWLGHGGWELLLPITVCGIGLWVCVILLLNVIFHSLVTIKIRSIHCLFTSVSAITYLPGMFLPSGLL